MDSYIPMTWVVWNVRGENKWYKGNELKKYIKTNHIKVAELVESEVKTDKASQVIQHRCSIFHCQVKNKRVWNEY